MKGGGGVTQKTKNTGCSKAECNILKRPEMIENQYLHNKTPLREVPAKTDFIKGRVGFQF